MKKQAVNPFLPLDIYIPDGEPHVFGDRVYLFGSHDKEGGERYCEMGDYLCWSAPVDDLANWRYDGVIYQSSQDPNAHEGCEDLYAPDVVQGNDGKYYLYYTLSGPEGSGFSVPFSVAVCDTPCGRYEYLGNVKNPDGTPFLEYITGDPAVMNDNGTIRLYYGWGLSLVAGAANGRGEPDHEPKFMERNQLLFVEKMLFKRSEEELNALEHDIMGANHVELCDDMMTVKTNPTRIVPSQFQCLGTSFEYHAFYEAASCRKINDTYYFIYSSQESNELCYATSKFPDRDFVYRGILNSNGDVGLNGRKPEDRLNMTANNHGSLECINGKWYIFYHRQTHNSTFSRQACAEPVYINEDGSIDQAECTSCGLNGGPLIAKGVFPAAICCNLTNGKMPHATNRIVNAPIPYITHDQNDRFIKDIENNTLIGYKYFDINSPTKLTITYRGEKGRFVIRFNDTVIGNIDLVQSDSWTTSSIDLPIATNVALYLIYQGDGKVDLLSLNFD